MAESEASVMSSVTKPSRRLRIGNGRYAVSRTGTEGQQKDTDVVHLYLSTSYLKFMQGRRQDGSFTLPLVRSTPLATVSKNSHPTMSFQRPRHECDHNRKQTRKGNPMFIPSSTFLQCSTGSQETEIFSQLGSNHSL